MCKAWLQPLYENNVGRTLNYINQFIQLTIQRYKSKLNITRPILVFIDPKEWIEIFPKDRKHVSKECALIQNDHNCIFLNLARNDHKSLLELEDSIVHELLHLKHPDKSESEIKELTERTLTLF